VEAAESDLIWQVGHHQRVGRVSREMGLPGKRDRLLHAGITGWNLSLRCRSEDAIDAVEQSVLLLSPFGSRQAELTWTTDNGMQFTSTRFLETLARMGITHRRTAYHHPEATSCIAFIAA
jgi:hypothetical protein